MVATLWFGAWGVVRVPTTFDNGPAAGSPAGSLWACEAARGRGFTFPVPLLKVWTRRGTPQMEKDYAREKEREVE